MGQEDLRLQEEGSLLDRLFAPGFPGLRIRVALVREGRPRRRPKAITGPEDAFRLIRRIGKADREHFVVILLNAKNLPLGVHLVSIGSLTASLVHPREVFKPALLANAAAFIAVHNHPSGDPSPSQDDLILTRRLQDAGRLLGIEVLDHLIVAGRAFVSLKEQGAMG